MFLSVSSVSMFIVQITYQTDTNKCKELHKATRRKENTLKKETLELYSKETTKNTDLRDNNIDKRWLIRDCVYSVLPTGQRPVHKI